MVLRDPAVLNHIISEYIFNRSSKLSEEQINTLKACLLNAPTTEVKLFLQLMIKNCSLSQNHDSWVFGAAYYCLFWNKEIKPNTEIEVGIYALYKSGGLRVCNS